MSVIWLESYVISVLICVSLPIKDVEHLDNTYWSFVSCPWELMVHIVDQYTDLLTSGTCFKSYLYTREVA